MHLISDLGGPGGTPDRPPGTRLVASIDVEWSKNYRITNGNRAFCYSIVWLAVPDAADHGPVRVTETLPFTYTSLYLDHDGERGDLVAAAAADLAAAAESADLITGHQLCSDLAVLTANAGARPPAALAAARLAWHARRADPARKVLDTRFDAGHLLSERSRRLVDVCGELALDVTQPELARKSMTALHRDWLGGGDTEARERVTALNLRHSLSTALVALRAAGHVTWHAPMNVNAMLATRLSGQLGWLTHPTFRALIVSGAEANR
ncbi:hypothetical protein [Dactylosporangium matsuzakiense]|uniref:Uncharacterized protein n=1 Tax=Dactylosporangium matsuzakiense TaxID=53360 RepID=A0A9W6KKH0_9ACTN|nr:hypothetical protein [Dactylosporangium matsuzakiense]GLL02194.1 hypothetical protein GCM10017581_039360 [Dactylosporangium matsuzakiense]